LQSSSQVRGNLCGRYREQTDLPARPGCIIDLGFSGHRASVDIGFELSRKDMTSIGVSREQGDEGQNAH